MRSHLDMRLKSESEVVHAIIALQGAMRRRMSWGENFWSAWWNEFRALLPRREDGVASTSDERLRLRVFGVVARVRWANKALEPTTMAVTPRAIALFISHDPLAAARGAPAMVVAHL
jgi:hypothetical protein